MHIILQTPRLIIREYLPEEEEAYLNYHDEEVLRYLPKRSHEERADRFRMAIAAYTDDKRMGAWGIFDKADGALIGGCLLRPFAGDAEKTELGYSLGRKYWGKGIGTEMAKAMVNYAIKNAAPAVVGITDLENTGSQRVLEKAGLKRMANIFEGETELAYFEINEGPTP